MIKRVLRGVTSRSPLAIKSSRGDVFATSAVTLRLKRISVAVRADSSTLTTKRRGLDWLQPCCPAGAVVGPFELPDHFLRTRAAGFADLRQADTL